MSASGLPDIAALCVAALTLEDPLAKARAAGRLARLSAKAPFSPGLAQVPERPGRPARPLLLQPRDMPKRKLGSPRGRAALLHALAHIELNAIDLALDIVARFGSDSGPLPPGLRAPFCRDWLAVAKDEARHFLMIARRLRQLGIAYGDLPAHDGLWNAAGKTRGDVLARLAIVPLVHEARGLDVQPVMVERLAQAGDAASARILSIVAADEISHVRTGYLWFTRLCALQECDPRQRYRELVAQHHGKLAPESFNFEARARAGLPAEFYQF